jgi:hypothetical protein
MAWLEKFVVEKQNLSLAIWYSVGVLTKAFIVLFTLSGIFAPPHFPTINSSEKCNIGSWCILDYQGMF